MPHRYIFVGGLHRTGTSLVAGMIGDLPSVAAIRAAPVPENEGVYLQGAIPHTARHGQPGAFALDPAQHHIEGGRYDTLAVRDRIEADWDRWFAPPTDGPDAKSDSDARNGIGRGDEKRGGVWRVEKSPVNLLRMRLYQQLFPTSQFVVVTRHPVSVARATAKWTDVGEAALIAHWARAYRLALEDIDHLHAVMVVRHEDLATRPQAVQDALAAFLDLPPAALLRDVRDARGDYGPLGLMRATTETAEAMAALGYAADGAVDWTPQVRHPLRRIREATEAALRSV